MVLKPLGMTEFGIFSSLSRISSQDAPVHQNMYVCMYDFCIVCTYAA